MICDYVRHKPSVTRGGWSTATPSELWCVSFGPGADDFELFETHTEALEYALTEGWTR